MIKSKEEYYSILERLRTLNFNQKLSRNLQAKLEAFEEMEELVNLTIPVVVRTLVCVDGSIPNLTEGKEYKILAETNRHYNLIDDNGNDVLIGKSYVRELKQAN